VIVMIVHRVTLTEEDLDVPDDARSLVAAPTRVTAPARFTAPWRQDVERRRLALATRALHIDDPAVRATILDLLASAHDAATAKGLARRWWWGTDAERAWAHLREAEEQLFEHDPNLGLATVDPDVVRHAIDYLPTEDPRRVLLAAADITKPADITDEERLARKRLQVSALRDAHIVADRRSQQARSLRNRLLSASIIVVLLLGALLLVQSRLGSHAFIAHDTVGVWTGDNWQLLGVVMLFGLLGSLLTAIPSLSGVPTDFSPFNLPFQQAVLKLTVGALTAVIGMIILTSGVVVDTTVDSLAKLLVFAITFGAGQQVVTRFVDGHAAEILNET
jgi:hypothetical protein